ncbi:hypothetical protein Tco_0434474 [Tanacetum coccineum]
MAEQELSKQQELTEQQKKRKAQVQFKAQHYTQEDWDTIRAKLEANEELTKSMIGCDLQQEDFANFEEVKAEFDKLVKQIESFVPMSFEATKAHLKRFGVDEAKEEEPTKKSGKRRKQIARKGLHLEKDETKKDTSEEDPTSGTNIPINHVPIATKPPSIANYKIIKQGKKCVYQIIRENGTDKVYINFGAMLKDISRDDLTELYRIVMHRYGMNEPEDEHEKVFWGYMKNMFDKPLNTDAIWSLPSQHRIINWVYYDECRVHCLNLESAEIYMLTERVYPLSAEVCNAMLNKKLQGGKEVEDC